MEEEENQDEYVETYHGASQLIAEGNPDLEKKLKDGNEESDDDFIASSQVMTTCLSSSIQFISSISLEFLPSYLPGSKQ